ncbi:MAG: V-type ATP synthase subunit F [Clostridia bacterium]
MHKGRIAVVGDKDSVLAFKALGLEVFPVTNQEEAEDTVKLLAREFAVIFITEQVAMQISSLVARYKSRPYPAVIPIPSGEGSNGFGMNGIRKDVEKAIGADILFNREDN